MQAISAIPRAALLRVIERFSLPIACPALFIVTLTQEDECGSESHADGQQRMPEPCDDMDFVHHVPTPDCTARPIDNQRNA